MSKATPSGLVAPNFRTPRLLGIFSVVFASELLIIGVFLCGYVALLPLLGSVIQSTQKQINARAEASKKADLDALAAREKAAKTEQEKIDVAVKRKEIESRPAAPFAGIMEMQNTTVGDPVFIRYSWVDVLTGMALNVLMLASGIGLLHWRPWARSLGVWTAAVKIVRLVLVYGFFIIAIVPPYSQRLGKAVVEMMASTQQMGGATGTPFASADFLVRIYTVTYSALGLGFMFVGAIYPAILLWFLTRPSVKSACSGMLRTPKEPNQPC
jgi:hypothetical protein